MAGKKAALRLRPPTSRRCKLEIGAYARRITRCRAARNWTWHEMTPAPRLATEQQDRDAGGAQEEVPGSPRAKFTTLRLCRSSNIADMPQRAPVWAT
jgi:hypothetical protein